MNLYETPRYLLSKNRNDDAIEVLKQLARENQVSIEINQDDLFLEAGLLKQDQDLISKCRFLFSQKLFV
jgi:hypothetical protein